MQMANNMPTTKANIAGSATTFALVIIQIRIEQVKQTAAIRHARFRICLILVEKFLSSADVSDSKVVSAARRCKKAKSMAHRMVITPHKTLRFSAFKRSGNNLVPTQKRKGITHKIKILNNRIMANEVERRRYEFAL